MFNYIIWALVAILYSPIIILLYKGRWELIDYTHAYFILPVSLYLTWRKRHDLSRSIKNPSPNLLGIPVLVIGILLFILGWRWDYMFIATFSLIPTILGIVFFLYGTSSARTIQFPLLYLLLMIPPPLVILDAITLPMRYGVSAVAAIILKSFHYPIIREGLLLYIGRQEIFMGAPCSGFRSLITMISLGLAYTYIINETRKNKTILLVSIIPLALLGNLIRVLTLCLVTYYFGAKAGQGFFHDFSGVIVFIIMILGLLGIESYLKAKRMANE